MKSMSIFVCIILVTFGIASAQGTLFAGSGSTLGDGGPATAAMLSGTTGICSDAYGNIYIMQSGGGRIRKVNSAGIITTIAGYGGTGFSGDSGLATAASFNGYGLGSDGFGNLYIGDWNNNRVRRIDATTGIITTVAGTGSSTSSGDGGPATAAGINKPICAVPDLMGNLYISEYASGVIRKVASGSGTISTFATGIAGPGQLATDLFGNVYVAAKSSGRIYRITPIGTSTIVAGGGSATSTGTGVPATSVSLPGLLGVTIDAGGNLYIADTVLGIYKVNTSGIITTVTTASTRMLALDLAGNLYWTNGMTQVWGILHASTYGASYVSVSSHTFCAGDTTTYVCSGLSGGSWATSNPSVVTINSATGFAVGLAAGSAAISYTTACCGSFTSATTVHAFCSGTPVAGYAYVEGRDSCHHPDTLKLGSATSDCGVAYQWQKSNDGFTWLNIAGATSQIHTLFHSTSSYFYRCAVVCVSSGASGFSSPLYIPSATSLYSVSNPLDSNCVGAKFYTSACNVPVNYYRVKTWFGDGTFSLDALDTTGVRDVLVTHHYSYPGIYTIKQILYDGSAGVDSVFYSYDYMYCNTLPVRYYVDIDSNCTINSADFLFAVPTLTEVDSNGIPIDTISSTGGFYYRAYGTVGTVYDFRLLCDSGLIACPVTGVVSDTISSYVTSYSTKYLAVKPAAWRVNLSINAVAGITNLSMQTGTIYIQNCTGSPTDATVKMVNDSVYQAIGGGTSAPTIVEDTTTWRLTAISPLDGAPRRVYFRLDTATSSLSIGYLARSSFSVSPAYVDVDYSNNACNRIDTVRAGYDPNFVECNPGGCLPYTSGSTELQYTIHFENTGNDTAHNIYVLDTLSESLLPGTLKVKMASASMLVSTMVYGHKTIVKFDFPNIKLLDSSHHGLCDGAVIYTIQTKSGLSSGTHVKARAGIYFDINPVVLTNESDNIVGCGLLNLANEQLHPPASIYPNPADGLLTINTGGATITQCFIADIVGKTILDLRITQQITDVDVSSLQPGTYFVRLIKTDGASQVIKFVK